MYRRARLGIGYLPQEVSIFRGLTVEDNILAILEIAEPDRIKRHERLEELLSRVLDRPPAAGAGAGALGRRAAAHRDRALPRRRTRNTSCSTSRSPASTRSRWARSAALVAELKTRGIGVLITDHNVRETLDIVDRAYILHDGQVLMSGTGAEVVRDENVRRVYLGKDFRIG